MDVPAGAVALVPWSFDASTGAWARVAPVRARARPAAPQRESVTVVTWNVWFGEYEFDARAEALLDVVEACAPDAIALQEVTAPFLARALARRALRDGYWVSDATGATLGAYGVVLASRLPARSLWLRALPSAMDRSLLCAELEVGDGAPPLAAATVHLESRRHNADTRADQLAEIQLLLRARAGDAVLVGDFNFCSSWRAENRGIAPDFVDVWPAVRGGAPGYTEDTDVNAMRLHQYGKEKQVRFDRVLLRSPARTWRPQAIRLLGTEPIAPSRPDVFPSDHFGLAATLVRS